MFIILPMKDRPVLGTVCDLGRPSIFERVCVQGARVDSLHLNQAEGPDPCLLVYSL